MTFRIVQKLAGDETLIELHGWLNTDEVAELDNLVAHAGRPVRIDLEHLASANADGLRALLRQESQGARLNGASPYVELLLNRMSGKEEP